MTKRISRKILKTGHDRCTVYTVKQSREAEKYMNKKLRKEIFKHARREALNGDDTFLKAIQN